MSDSNQTIVYIDADENIKGNFRFFDIENNDDAPDFIVRVNESARGKGIETELVTAWAD